jgi:micrococcal nuclease
MKYTEREYNAEVLRIVDGDTVELRVDLGFGISYKSSLRLMDFDAPETWRPKTELERECGEQVTEWLKNRIEGKFIKIKTYKRAKGKYGRILARLFVDDVDIINEMIDLGFEKDVMLENAQKQ